MITPDPPVAEVYHGVGNRHGSRLTTDVIRVRFHAAFRAEEEARSAGRLADRPAREVERWRRIVAAVLDDVTDSDACFHELWDHFASPANWRCLPDVGPVLTELSRRGLVIGLASNFDSRLRTVAAGLPELAPLGPVVVSAEVGWRKPAAEFFAAVVKAFGCEPSEVLLVGDDFENDYAGAAAAGLRAVLLDPMEPEGIRSITRLAKSFMSRWHSNFTSAFTPTTWIDPRWLGRLAIHSSHPASRRLWLAFGPRSDPWRPAKASPAIRRVANTAASECLNRLNAVLKCVRLMKDVLLAQGPPCYSHRSCNSVSHTQTLLQNNPTTYTPGMVEWASLDCHRHLNDRCPVRKEKLVRFTCPNQADRFPRT